MMINTYVKGVFIGRLRRLQPLNISEKFFKLRPDMTLLILVINRSRIEKLCLEKCISLPSKKKSKYTPDLRESNRLVIEVFCYLIYNRAQVYLWMYSIL